MQRILGMSYFFSIKNKKDKQEENKKLGSIKLLINNNVLNNFLIN